MQHTQMYGGPEDNALQLQLKTLENTENFLELTTRVQQIENTTKYPQHNQILTTPGPAGCCIVFVFVYLI